MNILNIDDSENAEPQGRGVWQTLRNIGASFTRRLGRLLTTKVPKGLQEQGLTQEVFEEFSRRFYERMRGSRSSTMRRISQDSESPFLDALMADGFVAHADRQDEVMRDFLGEFGFEDKPEIEAFLKEQLMPTPYMT
ncbi:hypothetical protein A3C37_01095 [Candidatus Peribacteria bacterium RIFCSPHIGHO2_02_FULL_53_20]|nr:MAG: hypothetical protein A3C37_01095 [Candidatus Peribacteria bacterium RIFCSPHIGHO2_02_FULL_53_20]OGJ67034.1 MAG: hypothetical protein A3B61_04780 [Candidatus Peribacteria bacterium RIFCSPLOWO2_01_FULL_53_10]